MEIYTNSNNQVFISKMALLTDQILASGVTLNDLFHIVITGDTSQNPAGSSYKATVQQFAQAIGSIGFSGGTVIYPTYFTNGLSANTFFATTYLNLPKLPYLPLSGGTVSGSTNFTGGLSANTFSATTYLNLPRLPYLPLSGGTVTGGTIFTSGLTANTFSATTYFNLPRLPYLPLSGGTVTGGTIFTSGLSANTFSATTYLNLPSGIIVVNSTQIQSGFTGGVLFQSSASTVTQTTGFTWDNTNKRLGIGINSPLYDLDVYGGIYQRSGELLITSTGGVNKEGPFIASSGGDELSSDRKIQLGISDNSSVPVGIDMFATNNSFSSSYINFRVNNEDLVKMSGSSVGIGTTTNAGLRLDVSGNTRINGGLTASTLNISSTPTTDTSLSANYLTRDSSTGNIKVKQIPGPTVYGLFAQTGDSAVISATTVETSLINGGLGTLSVPANGFSVGDSFRADIAGVMNSKNNETINIRVKANSVVLLDSGTQTLPVTTNDIWDMSINFTIRQIGSAGVASIVSLGTFHYTKTSNGNVEGFSFNTVNNTTFDTTIPNTLDILISWGSTDTGNSIYSDIFVLNKIF